MEEAQKQERALHKPYRIVPSTRLFTSLVVGIGLTTSLISVNNLNIAVICMVAENDTVIDDVMLQQRDVMLSDVINGTSDTTPGKIYDDGADLSQDDVGKWEFYWDKRFQALLLSAYFYGFSANMTPSGILTDRLPANWVLIFCIVTEGLLNLLLPVVARLNKYLLVALRIVMGANGALVFPATTLILRNWTVPEEFSTFFGLVWSMIYTGVAVSYSVNSSLCEAAGWSAVFYVTGALQIAWSALAWILIANTPEESSCCTEKERQFIVSRRHYRVTTKTSLKDKNEKRAPLPLWAIATNRQVLIIAACHFTYCWFYYSVHINMPVFLKETMGVNLSENGVLSSLPFLAMAVGVVFGGKLLHLLVTRCKFSQTNARKLLNLLGMLIPAACVCAKIFLPPGSRYATIAMITFASLIAVLMVSGGPMSAMTEIGPEHAGAIWGITATFGNLPGFLTPVIAAAMTPNKTLSEWRLFFLIIVVMLTVTSAVVLIFWKSEIQNFSRAKVQTKQHHEKAVTSGEVNPTFEGK